MSQLYASLIIIAGQSTRRASAGRTKSRPICQIHPWCTSTDEPRDDRIEPVLLQCTEYGNGTKRPSCLPSGSRHNAQIFEEANFRRVCPPITKTDTGDSWTTLLTIH